MNLKKQQELNENLNFLRTQFQELDGQIKLPHSLSADMLRYKLENIDLLDEKPKKKHAWFRPLAGVAACLVVVIGSIYAMRSTEIHNMIRPAAPQSAAPQAAAFSAEESVLDTDSGNAAYAADYTQLRDAVFDSSGGLDAYNDSLYAGFDSGTSAAAAAEEPAAAEPMPETAAAPKMAAAPDAQAAPAIMEDGIVTRNAPAMGAAFSTTNVQETGVDEADIVKTDGEYLYSFVRQNATTKSPTIFIAEAATMRLTSKIELGNEVNVSEFYIDGDRLVTVGSSYRGDIPETLPTETIVEATNDGLVQRIAEADLPKQDSERLRDSYTDNGRMVSNVSIYDISNHEKPKQTKVFAQDGFYTSSRLMDDTLYLISEHGVSPALDRKDTPLSALVPLVYKNMLGSILPADCIAVMPNQRNASYAVVSTMNVKTGVTDTQAVLGGSDGVYMSSDGLYVYQARQNEHVLGNGSYWSTEIVRFDAESGVLKLSATGRINGQVYGQFAFSEKDGNLRVAATLENSMGITFNNVYVLDKEMKEIGRLEGLAKGERIYSARYLGDMAYVVTFRETDPLFAIDLSDPTNPKLLGQLKIPGFSEYLHPIDQNTLLGIGQSADSSGRITGLKLSLFDVSDPLAPKELNVYNLGGPGSWSEALDNHRAVMFYPERNLLGFPAMLENQQSNVRGQVYCLFRYDKDKGFTLEKTIEHPNENEFSDFGGVNRGLYIGTVLYTFSPEKIISYDLDTFAEKQTLSLE